MAKIPSRKFAGGKKKIPSKKFSESKAKIPSRPFAKGTSKIPSGKKPKPAEAAAEAPDVPTTDRPVNETRQDRIESLKAQVKSLKPASDLEPPRPIPDDGP